VSQQESANNGRGGASRGWYALLLLPFIGTLIPPIYNTKDPTLIGIPFLYWYRMAWVPVSAAITIVVYRATKAGGER
jgi:hypothetical protein